MYRMFCILLVTNYFIAAIDFSENLYFKSCIAVFEERGAGCSVLFWKCTCYTKLVNMSEHPLAELLQEVRLKKFNFHHARCHWQQAPNFIYELATTPYPKTPPFCNWIIARKTRPERQIPRSTSVLEHSFTNPNLHSLQVLKLISSQIRNLQGLLSLRSSDKKWFWTNHSSDYSSHFESNWIMKGEKFRPRDRFLRRW